MNDNPYSLTVFPDQTAICATFSVTCSNVESEFFPSSSFELDSSFAFCTGRESAASVAFFAALAKLKAGRTVALAGGDDDLRATGGPRVEA